jgi:lipoprotein-releasing system permease protein
MIRPLELFVGLRYTRARRRHRIISFISLVSIVGIALGIAALITILSVMNGFGTEVRANILSFISHVTVTGPDERLRDWESVGARLKDVPHITHYAPFIDGQGLVAHGKEAAGVQVRGVLPAQERHVSEIADKLVAGSLDALRPGEYGVVVGQTIAWKFGLQPGSQVSLVVPQVQVTPAGMLPRFRRFTVVGIFRANIDLYDRGVVLVHIDDAARLFQMQDQVTGMRLKLDDVDRARRVSAGLEQALGFDYRTRDWTREQPAWFRALAMEKTAMFLILSLIVAVAMFNVISTLTVVVNEKRADIAILRTLGASPRSIMAIFMVQGSLIGVAGTVAGVIAGVLLALNVSGLVRMLETVLGLKFLAPEIYFLSDLPSDLQSGDVITIAIVSLALSLLSTLYPAWRASQTQPAEALRYE